MLVTRHHRPNALDAWWFRCSEKDFYARLQAAGKSFEWAA